MASNLIVLMAFDRDEQTGELRPAFEPREMRDQHQAKQQAALLKHSHTGVIAWVRSADPDLGEFGPPEIIVIYGEVPDME